MLRSNALLSASHPLLLASFTYSSINALALHPLLACMCYIDAYCVCTIKQLIIIHCAFFFYKYFCHHVMFLLLTLFV